MECPQHRGYELPPITVSLDPCDFCGALQTAVTHYECRECGAQFNADGTPHAPDDVAPTVPTRATVQAEVDAATRALAQEHAAHQTTQDDLAAVQQELAALKASTTKGTD